MTKTTLSDGRRTRPRFAAPTPTPPKFLIATFEQPKNHSTPSKQTTNPNPNSNKTLLLRPGRPCGTALLRISRPLSGLLPFAQPQPRKPSGLSQSLGLTPFAQPHPRKPSGLSQSLGLTPFARPHLRNAVTPLPALFLYRWPPAGVFQVLPTSRPPSSLTPLAQPHPRNEQSAGARSAETSKTPARCRRHKNQPLALTFALEAPLATAFLIVTPRLEIAATSR